MIRESVGYLIRAPKFREIKLNNSKIRSVNAEDIPFLKDVVDTNSMFPSDMLDDMIGSSLEDDTSQEYWLTYDAEKPIAVAYFAPERMTSGTWNLLLIAVHIDHQGSGVGTTLMEHIESFLKLKQQRLLVVETSDLDEFALTRKFYQDIGYIKEAHIREFYDKDEGKVVYWKKLI